MRIILLFLILTATNGLISHAWAEEIFLGRIISVDREKGSLSVLLMENDDHPDTSGKSLAVTIPKERLPKNLIPGQVIRLWGETSSEKGVINATSLKPSGRGGYGKDPTGVRRRIGKSRGQFGGHGGGKGRGNR